MAKARSNKKVRRFASPKESGGKPAAIKPSRKGAARNLVVGIDLGGTNMQFGVVDPAGKVIKRDGKKTRVEQGTKAVLEKLVEGVEGVCAEAGVSVKDLRAVGIGAPGAIDPVRGVVLEAPNLRWNNMPLAKTLRQRLGVEVVLENDVNAAVYGEWKMGAAKGAGDFMGVWLGTGVGGGFVLNGRLYEGGFFTAGEIGHMNLIPGAPYGRSSVEQNCSRTAVVERLQFLIRANNKSKLTELSEGDLSAIRSKLVGAAYRANDKLTVRVLDECAEIIGRHIGSCVTLLSLPLIVLGGGLSEAMGEEWVKLVERHVREAAFPTRCKAVRVVASQLRDDAGVIGAAMLAREAVAR